MLILFPSKLGYEEYIAMGIDPKKLVMGVPWYGYDYVCQNLSTVRWRLFVCNETVLFFFFIGKIQLDFGNLVFGLGNNCGLMDKSIKLGHKIELFAWLIIDEQLWDKAF